MFIKIIYCRFGKQKINIMNELEKLKEENKKLTAKVEYLEKRVEFYCDKFLTMRMKSKK